jgi:titin
MALGSTGTVTAGPASGAILPLTVTGVAAGAQSSVLVYTDRAGYASGVAMVTGSGGYCCAAELKPTLDTPVSTADGFTVNVTNYDPAFQFFANLDAHFGSGDATIGAASGGTLPITVSGLFHDTTVILLVDTARAGFYQGSSAVVGRSLLNLPAVLTPTFSIPVSTADGFTVNVTNYNSAYTFTASIPWLLTGSVSTGTPSGSLLPMTVTGLAAGVSSTVSVTTSRVGILGFGTATVTGSALAAALAVTRFHPAWTFTPSQFIAV